MTLPAYQFAADDLAANDLAALGLAAYGLVTNFLTTCWITAYRGHGSNLGLWGHAARLCSCEAKARATWVLVFSLNITVGAPLQNSQTSAVPPVWHTMHGLAANGLAMYRLAAYGLAGKAWPRGGRCSLWLAEISPEGIPTS